MGCATGHCHEYMGVMGANGTKAHGAICGLSREDSEKRPDNDKGRPTPAARMRAVVSAAAAIATSS